MRSCCRRAGLLRLHNLVARAFGLLLTTIAPLYFKSYNDSEQQPAQAK